MYKHILIPTDGSELSKIGNSGRYCVGEGSSGACDGFNCDHAISSFHDRSQYDQGYARAISAHTEALAQQYLDVAKDFAAKAGVPCDLVHIEQEHPYRAIIDTAQSRGCDAIQMASHGRRGISAVLLGSETLKVLTHTTIPVIVCRRPPLGTLFQESFAS